MRVSAKMKNPFVFTRNSREQQPSPPPPGPRGVSLLAAAVAADPGPGADPLGSPIRYGTEHKYHYSHQSQQPHHHYHHYRDRNRDRDRGRDRDRDRHDDRRIRHGNSSRRPSSKPRYPDANFTAADGDRGATSSTVTTSTTTSSGRTYATPVVNNATVASTPSPTSAISTPIPAGKKTPAPRPPRTRERRRPRPLPQLPEEIWAQIITHITSPRHVALAWLNCRRVSRSFKRATEYAFLTANVPKLSLVFPHLRPVHDTHCFRRETRLGFRFSHLEDHPGASRAVFRLDDPAREHTMRRTWIYMRKLRGCSPPAHDDGWPAGGDVNDLGFARRDPKTASTVWQVAMAQWREQVLEYLPFDGAEGSGGGGGGKFHLPPHVLVFGDVANDTELPGLEVDFAAKTVSFLWKPALDRLFREEEYMRWLRKVDLDQRDEPRRAKRMLDAIAAGHFYLEEDLKAMVFAEPQDGGRGPRFERDTVRSLVRQKRILRWYRDRGVGFGSAAFEELAYRKFLGDLKEVIAKQAQRDEFRDAEPVESNYFIYEDWGCEAPQDMPVDDALCIHDNFSIFY